MLNLKTSAIDAGRKAVTVAAVAIYTIVFAELFIRLVHPQPRMPRYITGTSWGVRGNIPNAIYRHKTAEVDVGFHINSQGMRADRDYPREKPEGVCRIALFGDSFFMGYELDLQDTLAARLEHALNAQAKAVEVLNFAVSGFGTAESLQTLEAYANEFSPDIVLLEWDRSDYDDNIRANLFQLEDGKLVRVNNSYLPSVATQDILMRSSAYRWVADHSELYSMLRERLSLHWRDFSAHAMAFEDRLRNFVRVTKSAGSLVSAAAQAFRPETHETHKPEWASTITQEEIDLSRALIESFRAKTQADRQGFLLVEIPFKPPMGPAVSSLSLIFKPDETDVSFISPVPAFNNASDEKLYYTSGDGHVTPYAIGLMLDMILARLETDPHLSRCVGSNGPNSSRLFPSHSEGASFQKDKG